MFERVNKHIRLCSVVFSLMLPISSALAQNYPDAGIEKTIRPSNAALSDPTVVTRKTVEEYYLDLETCRSSVAKAMGPVIATDDVGALKRALESQDASGTSINVPYSSDDRAVVRDKAIRGCLERAGYLVKQ